MRHLSIAAVLACMLMLFALVGAGAETINELRAAHRLPPLAISGRLNALADAHARDMARRNQLDHAGFAERRGPAGAMAENVAYGCGNATCTIAQWMRSPGHRANILLRAARSYGLASARSAAGRVYWAMEIGD